MRKLSEFLARRKTAQLPAIDNSADHDAHMYLGNMYLALGQTAQAETEFSRAQTFSPSEESKKQLAVARKRRVEERHAARAVGAACRAA
jgi:Flp pilus assembly protein TadD